MKRCKICNQLTVTDDTCGWCGIRQCMAASVTETSIRNGIVQWLTAYHVFAWPNDTVGIYDAKSGGFRTNPKRLRGVADILGIVGDGKLLAIEVKRGRNKCSEEQTYFLDRIRQGGGVAMVARCVRDVRKGLADAGIDIDEPLSKIGL